jgi:hypothetical protein
MDAKIIDEQLRQLITEKWGDAETFFNNVTKGDGISRGKWKAALRQLGMDLSDESRKALRKRVTVDGSKMVSLKALIKFMGSDSKKMANFTDGGGNEIETTVEAGQHDLAPIPSECPSLPSNFHSRGAAQDELVALLVGVAQDSDCISLTAPKSRSNKVTSQGSTNLFSFFSCFSSTAHV